MAKNEEFEAPEWVTNDSETPPVTAKQKRILNISLSVSYTHLTLPTKRIV